MKEKICSRKFLMCLAAFLASIATSISGIATNNQIIIILGTVCGIVSAAIYAFCEAWVDAKAVDQKGADNE
jgi:MFS family permease